MRIVVLLFAIVLNSTLIAQSNKVYVEYSVKINDEKEMFVTDAEYRRIVNKAKDAASHLSFGLLITKNGSKFFKNNTISEIDDFGFNNDPAGFVDYHGETFQYQNAIYSYSTQALGTSMMVKESLKSNWILHTETRTIDNYTCYKATNVNTIDNGPGLLFHHPVIAWYCPELPYSYGPNGYSNLPGLILQLQVRNVIFSAKKIDLNSILDYDPSFLKNVKTLTQEEVNKKINDEMQLLGKSLKD